MILLYVLYSLAAAGLALYGINTLVTLWLYWRKRHQEVPLPPVGELPTVTVQLPIFNELYVVERLIHAAARLEWNCDRLQIQVLDDSDDQTTSIAQACVDLYRKQGIDISLLHRTNRKGFKAGALAYGLESARGEFIAIFDADFVPPPDFLKKTVPHFSTSPQIGLVQARWGHLNDTYSPLTRAQSIALDGHFVVEQTARSRNNLFMNFNGTAGVWRRTCIESCGGWQGDTLSEDLDLSYRAQMGGWKFIFLPDIIAPAEIPPQIHGFKRQQFRWAKGSTQCLVKLAPRVVTYPGLSLFKRLEGLFHLSSYLVHPLILILLLTLVPLMALNVHLPAVMGYFSLTVAGPILVYAISQRELYPDWSKRFRYFTYLLLLGTGIALSNSLAVFGALTKRGNNFRRTPKFSVQSSGDSWATKQYALPFSWEAIGEVGLALYALVGVVVAWEQHFEWSVPFLLLYAASFGFTGILSLWHSRVGQTAVATYRPRVRRVSGHRP